MRDSRYDTCHLFFEEKGHKYTDSYGRTYKSTTTLIHEYKPEFNKKYWLHKKSRELGISEKQLAKQWEQITKEACERGTNTHNELEDAIKDVSKFKNAIKYLTNIYSGRVVSVADIPNFKAKPLDIEAFKKATNYKYDEIYRVFDFYTQRGYTIYSEIGAYLIDYLISGTIDILCIRDTDFVILDWKTNRKGLQFEAGYFEKDKTTIPQQETNKYIVTKDKMNPPIQHMPDCNGTHYTLQLSIYALMVELILNIPCVGLGLCHIGSPFIKNAWGMPYKDEYNQYPIDLNGEETVKWFRIPYKKNEAKLILNDRLIEVKSELKNNINQPTLF